MNKNTWIYILVLSFLVPMSAEAQRWKLRRYEAGLGTGTVHTFMDIGSPNYDFRSFQVRDSRVNVNSHIGFKILEDLTVKLDLNYLIIGGIDPEIRDRSLSFTSHNFEHLVRLDYNVVGGGRTFSSSSIYNRRGMVNRYGGSSGYLYVFAGAGGIMSKSTVRNAQGEEAVENPSYYNNLNWAFVIPAGLGYKYSFNAYWDLSFEVGARVSFNDRIDGYDFANPEANRYNDHYGVTTIKAIYKIRNDRRGVPIFNRYGRR